MSTVSPIFGYYKPVKIIGGKSTQYVALVTKDNKEYYLKARELGSTSANRNSFEEEVAITRDMANLDIAPRVIDYYVVSENNQAFGVMISEKFDLPYEDISSESNEQVDDLIQRMHNVGLVHGDLFGNNIVVDLKKNRFAIIDYEVSFYIDRIPKGRLEFLSKKFGLSNGDIIEQLRKIDRLLYWDEI